MILDSLIVPEATATRKSFVGLMALYESNYMRLLRLVPDLENIDGCFVSKVAGECDLYVEIIDSSRYTVTLSLSYRMPSDEGVVMNPDMSVRAYLDGMQAEVLAIGEKQRHAALRRLVQQHRGELNRRWRSNMILNKWLDYLSHQGHLILDR